jgi:hypothetical protein
MEAELGLRGVVIFVDKSRDDGSSVDGEVAGLLLRPCPGGMCGHPGQVQSPGAAARQALADTLLLTVPNQLGVDCNAHVIEAILKHVAPSLGWRVSPPAMPKAL